ncbi:MAG: primase-like DNA-binding domain-containing protein, partial [Cyanobacteria bacterium P01_C01_bin.120]
KRFVLPPRLNPEEHIFNLAFNVPGKPVKVIDHAFREYNSEYGYWQSIVEESLAQRVMSIAKKSHYPDTKRGPGKSLGTVANMRKALDHAGVELFNNSLETNNSHLIAFKNGTVCTKTGDLSPHNPDYYITSGLPYEYHKGSECPEPMARYIASSFGAENIEYVRAGLGCILDLTAKDKFIHAIGPSGSGKGVLTRLVMKFFGSESVGSPNNFKLFANPDQVHQYLSGKRLIAIDDIVGFVGEEIGRFYTAVERTAMNARCLFKPKGYTQSFDIRYIVASTGQLPTKYSNSKGWERRVFPMPTIGRQEPDDNLERELEGCIANIISWVLAQDKAQRNAILEHPERHNELAEEYFIEAAYSSSSAWGFIEECLKPVEPHHSDLLDDQTVEIAYFYDCYKAYCAATGRNSVSLDNLKHELKQAIPANYIKRQSDGAIPNRFVYLKLTPFTFDKTEAGIVTCDISKLSHNGVSELKQWARRWGALHPYNPGSIPTGTLNLEYNEKDTKNVTECNDEKSVTQITPECNDSATNNVAEDTKSDSMQAMQAMQAQKLELSDVCCVDDICPHRHNTQNDPKENSPAWPAWPAWQNSPDNLQGLTVTPDCSQDQHYYEQRIIDAETLYDLEQVKLEYDYTHGRDWQSKIMDQWAGDGRRELLLAKIERLKNEEQAARSREVEF